MIFSLGDMLAWISVTMKRESISCVSGSWTLITSLARRGQASPQTDQGRGTRQRRQILPFELAEN